MRVLFIYPNIEQNAAYTQLGISSLSACLKQRGHEIDLLDYTFLDLGRADEELAGKLAEFDPGAVGISIRSFEWDLVRNELLPVLHKAGIPAIVGGPHPTAVPDEVMEEEGVTALVRGEGELVMNDLVDALDRGDDISDINGAWVRTDDGIVKNDVRPLIQDLDTLPFPDWDIWDRRHLDAPHYKMFKEGITTIGAIETSRGCPYSCPYCMSSLLHGLYRGTGRYHREKTIDRTIEEVLDKKERFGLDYVNFVDETFLLKTKRVEEFCDKWIQQVNLPFRCATRPETVTDDRIRMVKEAGLNVMGLGIESGDPTYRTEHLNRRYSQDQVRNAVEIIKRHDIITYGFFIIGMPYETRETIQSTLDLIQSLDLDHYMITLCYPFQGTPFYDVAIREGLFHSEGSKVPNIWEDTPLELPTLSHDHLVRLRYLGSYFARKNPRWQPVMNICEKHPLAFKAWQIYRKFERRLKPERILD